MNINENDINNPIKTHLEIGNSPIKDVVCRLFYKG